MTNKKEGKISFLEVKQKSLEGFLFMSFRRVVIFLTAFLANILLARNITPADFGLFAIMSFMVSILTTINDFGLNAAVIQHKEDLKSKEKVSIFTLQVLITVIYIIIFSLAFPYIARNFYHLNTSLFYPMNIMLLGVFFNILASFPFAYLERSLEFRTISIIEMVSTITYQITAVILAVLHAGLWALILGFMTLNLMQLLLTWRFTKFKPSFSFHFYPLKKFLGYGISFQLSSLVNLIKDSLTPIFVGTFSGVTAVGLLDWAKTVVITPTYVTESFGRIAFPAYSRLQQDKEQLGKSIESSIKLITIVTFPITLYLAFFGKELVHIIYTDKWVYALPSLYFFSLGAFFTGVSAPLYYGILALGNRRIILNMSLVLFALEWGLGIPMVLKFGYLGIPILSGPISWTFLFVYYFALRVHSVKINMRKALTRNIIINFATFTIIVLLKSFIPLSLISFVLISLTTVALYCALSFVFNRDNIMLIKNLLAIK